MTITEQAIEALYRHGETDLAEQLEESIKQPTGLELMKAFQEQVDSVYGAQHNYLPSTSVRMNADVLAKMGVEREWFATLCKEILKRLNASGKPASWPYVYAVATSQWKERCGVMDNVEKLERVESPAEKRLREVNDGRPN